MKTIRVKGNYYRVTDEEFFRGWAQVGLDNQGWPILWEASWCEEMTLALLKAAADERSSQL